MKPRVGLALNNAALNANNAPAVGSAVLAKSGIRPSSSLAQIYPASVA